MSDLYYNQKYLKYKKKYLKLNGGMEKVPREAIQMVYNFMNDCVNNYTQNSPKKLKELTLSFSNNIIPHDFRECIKTKKLPKELQQCLNKQEETLTDKNIDFFIKKDINGRSDLLKYLNKCIKKSSTLSLPQMPEKLKSILLLMPQNMRDFFIECISLQQIELTELTQQLDKFTLTGEPPAFILKCIPKWHKKLDDLLQMKCILNDICKLLNIENLTLPDFNIELSTFMSLLFNKYNVNNTNTLQYSHWVYNNQLLMSALPPTCEDLKSIIETNKISMIISLRENDELYQRCSNLTIKPIFWRFRIPDFGYQDAEDFKALIDNIINYIKSDNNHKVMVHCLGGHGRSGSVICSVIAILVILQSDDLQPILQDLKSRYKFTYNSANSIDVRMLDNMIKTHNINDIDHLIHEITKKIFILSQIYVMLSLRMYRITDNKNYRPDIKQILVPETHAQNEMVIEVIKLFLHEYLINDTFNFDIPHTNVSIKNTKFEKAWKCPINIDKDDTKNIVNNCNK